MRLTLLYISFLAVVTLSACGHKPTEAELRAMDNQAMADAENESINSVMNSTGLNRQQAEEKQLAGWEADEKTENRQKLTPEGERLLEEYEKHPKETVDRLCARISKNGC